MASTVDSSRVREYSEDAAAFNDKMDQLAAMVEASKYTVFYTGAGISTSAGVGDYRGPKGAWTMRKIAELEAGKRAGTLDEDELEELTKLKAEAARAAVKAEKKVNMEDAQPTLTHMAMSSMIRLGKAHFVVTTNLDGIHRKSGLKGHTHLCNLHGDIFIERCTGCKMDYERNYHVRQPGIHVHDHKVGIGKGSGVCANCGSAPLASYTGKPGSQEMKNSKWGGCMVGTKDKNMGTKDTHINFGEHLDELDWDEAEEHCGKADLCIVAGTSMSLRHITHMPFLAKKVVIINLQATPDDDKCDLRIWAQTDPVFEALMERLGCEIDPIPPWRPEHSVPLDKLPRWVDPYYREAAARLEAMAVQREQEAAERAEFDRAAAERAASAAGASREATLVVGNTHALADVDEGDSNTHFWTIFVRPDARLAPLIKDVTFHLHPTFSKSVVRVGHATGGSYEISRRGWGTFDIGVTVSWNDGTPALELTHTLSFERDETATRHAVPL